MVYDLLLVVKFYHVTSMILKMIIYVGFDK